jgi:rod shape-determining protein MreD
MNDTYELRGGESHIEVHKFFPGAVVGIAVLSLVLQRILPVYLPRLEILDLPLLATIYFGLSRRNPSSGLFLGTLMGLMQDSLSGPTVPMGEYGIAKTVIGYLASSIGSRLTLSIRWRGLPCGPLLRGAPVHPHGGARLLLNEPEGWFNMHLAIASLVNAVLGVILFGGLDRLRRSS